MPLRLYKINYCTMSVDPDKGINKINFNETNTFSDEGVKNFLH